MHTYREKVDSRFWGRYQLGHEYKEMSSDNNKTKCVMGTNYRACEGVTWWMTQSEIEGHVTGPKSYAFVKCYPSKKWKEVERQADVERRNLQAPLQVDTHASVAPTVEDSGGGVLPGGVYLGTPSPDPPSKVMKSTITYQDFLKRRRNTRRLSVRHRLLPPVRLTRTTSLFAGTIYL